MLLQCRVCPDGHVCHVLQLSYRDGQSNGFARRPLSDTNFLVDDHVANVGRPVRKLPPDADRCVLGASSGVRVSIDHHGTPRLVVGETARGTWSKYRPIRLKRVRSARVAFPTARLHSLQATAMSGLSDAMYASLADAVIGFLPIRLQFFVVQWCVWLGGLA